MKTKTVLTSYLVPAIAAFCSLTASAVPIDIQVGNAGGNMGTENILFNEPGLQDNGTTVQGISNQTDFVVNFDSSTSLNTPSSGQARVAGNFSDLLISLDNGGTFTTAIMNLNANANGTVGFIVSYIAAAGSPFQESFSVSQNGQNFFQIIADEGAQISSISITGTGTTFEDVRQVRIGGFQNPTNVPDGGTTAVMLGAGFLGLAALRRKLTRHS